MRRDIYLVAIGDRRSKLDSRAVDIGAPVQVVIAHPLKKILKVAFVRLKDTIQNSSLVEEIGKPSHMHRIEHVHLKEEFISNTITIKWNAFDQRDVPNIDSLPVVGVSAVSGSKCMVN